MNLNEMDYFIFFYFFKVIFADHLTRLVYRGSHNFQFFGKKKDEKIRCAIPLHMGCYFAIDQMKYMTAYMTSSKWHIQILDM